MPVDANVTPSELHMGEQLISTKSSARPLWNSLEISKLIVGAMTPIAVTGFGVFLTLAAEGRSDHRIRQAERRAEDRERAAEGRANNREKEAQTRDFDWRQHAERREAERAAAFQKENHKFSKQMASITAARDDLLQQQAASRDDTIRDQSQKREDEIREQSAKLERTNRLIERRSGRVPRGGVGRFP